MFRVNIGTRCKSRYSIFGNKIKNLNENLLYNLKFNSLILQVRKIVQIIP